MSQTIAELAATIQRRREAEDKRRAELPLIKAKEREAAQARFARQAGIDARHKEWVAGEAKRKSDAKRLKRAAKRQRRIDRIAEKARLPPRKPTEPVGDPSSSAFYGRRDNLIRRLGFKSYAEYLDSATWKAIRSNVNRRDAHLCRLCGADATEVHHTLYDLKTLRGDHLVNLYSICRDCHKRVEFEPGSNNRRKPNAMKLITEFLASERTELLKAATELQPNLDEEFRGICSGDKAPELREPPVDHGEAL